MSSNRNKLLRWFITFPKCEISKTDFSRVILKSHQCVYLKACQEAHKDGTPHLHIFLILANALTRSQFLKFFKLKFPDDYKRIDLKPVRNIRATDRYCDKEDPEPFVVGTIPKPRKPRSLRQMYLDGDLTAWQLYARAADPFLRTPTHPAFYPAVFDACFPGIPYPSEYTQKAFELHEFSWKDPFSLDFSKS